MYDVQSLSRVQNIEVGLGVGKIKALDNYAVYFSN